MAKKSKFKKIVKIVVGAITFLTLPTLLFFGFIYLKYNEDLPIGKTGAEADLLANKMLKALNYDNYKATDYIEWTFKNRNSYKWYKSADSCEVNWKHFKVMLNFNKIESSKVYVANQLYNGIEKQKYITKAESYFNNDSFWLVAPYKVFDKGVTRSVVKTKQNTKALLVTYNSGGTTPGDSYLWYLDKNGMPKSYKMWVDIIPIGGLEASWENWTTSTSGISLSTFHKLLFLDIEITNIKTMSY